MFCTMSLANGCMLLVVWEPRDGYEQPFHSLDLNYSFYPSNNWTVKLKVLNLLDETIEIERAGVLTYAEKPGTAFALKVKYDY